MVCVCVCVFFVFIGIEAANNNQSDFEALTSGTILHLDSCGVWVVTGRKHHRFSLLSFLIFCDFEHLMLGIISKFEHY